jgi:lipopolysaccharide export system protein LptA
LKNLITILLLLLFSPNIFGQGRVTKIEILNANTAEIDAGLGSNVKRLIGDVRFKHEGVIMNCDSAYLYGESNSLDAFGRIYINQGDTVHLYGDLLKYYGNTRKAEIIRNVKLVDKEITLTSNILTYDMKKDVSYYSGGGRTISKNNDTLTSKIGYYYSASKELFFKDSVVLINPEYLIESDTLKFHTVTEVASFFGPTYIRSKENLIYCENGWYDTKRDVSQFKKNAYLENKEQKLRGDSLYYDRKAGYGEAFQNVEITDTINKFILNGNYAIHYEHEEESTITGMPMLTMIFDSDSLFLHADTLFAQKDSTGEHRIIHAYHHSKFFKEDMQGACDSLVYNMADSLINLYKAPVLWSNGSQMTAEFIKIKTSDGKVEYVFMETGGFIVSKEDSTRFNQVKGKDITALFSDNKLNRIEVKENGETIYFAREDNGDIFGMNSAVSRDLLIFVKENNIEQITFIGQPVATLYPIDDVVDSQTKLANFKWFEEIRPKQKEDIFIRKKLEEPEPAKESGKKKKKKLQAPE